MPVKKGIGLANVMERITYHYGEAYGIEVDSEPGRGTVVSLRLPYLRRRSPPLTPFFDKSPDHERNRRIVNFC
ncbi:hypothetical protein D3C81_565400 [compost metagenome]